MRSRPVGVGVLGMALLAGLLVSGAAANEFYQAGEAREIQGADNLGKTIVHYLVVLGLPMLSAGMMAGGLMRLRQNPGQGGVGIAGGVGAGYLASITSNLHQDAAAAVALGSLGGSLGWFQLGVGLLLQAAVVASLVCWARGSLRCGRSAAASTTSR